MKLFFKNKKIIFSNPSCNYFQCPVPIQLNSSTFRIFFSDRDLDNHSKIKYFDFCLAKKEIISFENLVIDEKITNDFDRDGKIPSSILKIDEEYYLLYTGIKLGKKFPYHNSIGVLKSHNLNTFHSLNNEPLIPSSSIKKNYFNSAGNLFLSKGIFYLFYSSCFKWEIISSKMEPSYNINLAKSNDLKSLRLCNNASPIVNFNDDDGGAVNFSIVKIPDFFLAFSCSRKKTLYRDNANNAYKLLAFKSNDLYSWDPLEIEYESSDSKWDNIMKCYPSAIIFNEKIYIFFNGNGFGKTGIGLAEVEIKV